MNDYEDTYVERIQCEHCDEIVPEDECVFHTEAGYDGVVTLAFCSSCQA
jgi:hypothetical protein